MVQDFSWSNQSEKELQAMEGCIPWDYRKDQYQVIWNLVFQLKLKFLHLSLQQFSYITSHNLRAPLSNLTGLLNLIDDIPIEDPELKEILDGFNKSTHLLNETINDLVKVIIIKDNPSIEKEELMLNDIFEDVFSQLSFLIGLHKPIIKFNFDEVSFLNTNKFLFENLIPRLNLHNNDLI